MQQNTSLLLNYHHNFIFLTRFASLMVRCNKHVRHTSFTLSSAEMMNVMIMEKHHQIFNSNQTVSHVLDMLGTNEGHVRDSCSQPSFPT